MARTTLSEEALVAAEEVGRGLAQAGITLICGGLGGVMEAAARGASGAGGEVIGIVPGDDPADASPPGREPGKAGLSPPETPSARKGSRKRVALTRRILRVG